MGMATWIAKLQKYLIEANFVLCRRKQCTNTRTSGISPVVVSTDGLGTVSSSLLPPPLRPFLFFFFFFLSFFDLGSSKESQFILWGILLVSTPVLCTQQTSCHGSVIWVGNSFSRHYSLIFFQHIWILWCRVCLTTFASQTPGGMTRNAVLKYSHVVHCDSRDKSGVTAINTGVITSVGGGLSCQLTNHKRYAQLQLADRDAANVHLGEASLIWSPCPWWLLGRGCGLEIMGVVHLRLTTLFPPLLQRNINVINMNNSWVSSWSVTLRYASQEVFQFAAKLPCKLKS